MATAVTSTPPTRGASATEVSPSPGRWRHPKFDEIARRQKAALFDESNIQTIFFNLGVFVATWIARILLNSSTSLHAAIIVPAWSLCGAWPLYTLWLLSFYNISVALMPLFRKTDNLTDIDLTASQRSLLGLDPNATPPVTPTTKYTTPPRYPRSATPLSGAPGSRRSSASGSVYSRGGSPLRRQSSESFTPYTGPLFQKSKGPESRRQSYGFGTPPSPGTPAKNDSVFAPNTPSPSGRGSSVTLNSRWLYERGRSTSWSRF